MLSYHTGCSGNSEHTEMQTLWQPQCLRVVLVTWTGTESGNVFAQGRAEARARKTTSCTFGGKNSTGLLGAGLGDSYYGACLVVMSNNTMLPKGNQEVWFSSVWSNKHSTLSSSHSKG